MDRYLITLGMIDGSKFRHEASNDEMMELVRTWLDNEHSDVLIVTRLEAA